MKYRIEIKLHSTGETASFEIQNINRWCDLTEEIYNWARNTKVIDKTSEMIDLLKNLDLTATSKIIPLKQEIFGKQRYLLRCEEYERD